MKLQNRLDTIEIELELREAYLEGGIDSPEEERALAEEISFLRKEREELLNKSRVCDICGKRFENKEMVGNVCLDCQFELDLNSLKKANDFEENTSSELYDYIKEKYEKFLMDDAMEKLVKYGK